MSVIKMTDLDLAGKRVFIRADLNVPVKDGKVTSDARIRASLPTIELALKQGAKVMVTSHLGRPTEGEYNEEFSLLPVVNYLKDKLSNPVRLVKDYLDGVDVAEGELVVLENVRFNKGEKKDDETLSKKYAALCDVFVMDAFGTAHRAPISNVCVRTPFAVCWIPFTNSPPVTPVALKRISFPLTSSSSEYTRLTSTPIALQRLRSCSAICRFSV